VSNPLQSKSFDVLILGRKWRFRWQPQRWHAKRDGECDNPSEHEREIWVYDGLTGRYRLQIALHEWTHAAWWWLPEFLVRRLAKELSWFLWHHLKLRFTEDSDGCDQRHL
jgi:hypothetical protein